MEPSLTSPLNIPRRRRNWGSPCPPAGSRRHEPSPFDEFSRFRLAAAWDGSVAVRHLRGRDLFGNPSHQVLRISHEANVVDRRRPCSDVYPLKDRLSSPPRLGSLGLWRVPRSCDSGADPRDWAQGPRRQTLDQTRSDAFPALRVDEADPDPHGGPLLRQPGRTAPHLARHLQGICSGGCADAACFERTRPWHCAHVFASSDRRALSWRNQPAPGFDPWHGWHGAHRWRVDERQVAKTLSKGTAYQLHQP